MQTRTLTLALTLTLTLTLTLAAGTAFAGPRTGAFTVSPMVGVALFEGDQNLDDGLAYGVNLGYNLSETLAVELGLTGVGSEVESSDNDVSVSTWHLDGIFNLEPSGELVPYLAAGLGVLRKNPDHGGSDSEWLANWGLGLNYYVSDDVALRGDLRHLAVFDESNLDHDLVATVGFLFQIGGAAATPPRDSDGDGVVDRRDRCPGTPRGVLVDERGCPLTFTLQIEFDHDQADIRPEYHGMLAEAAEFIRRYPAPRILIAGHTDSDGDDAYNLDLSQRRAASVRQYLIDNFGISANKLVARGYGESRPLADNATAEGRQTNRRVEVTCCAVLPE